MASSENHTFHVDDLDKLKEIRKTLVQYICGAEGKGTRVHVFIEHVVINENFNLKKHRIKKMMFTLKTPNLHFI